MSCNKRKHSSSDTESSAENDLDFEDSYVTSTLKSSQLNKPFKSRIKSRSISRNALIARENRLKKKLYMKNLEDENSTLKSENKKISMQLLKQSDVIIHLERELKYLKSVLANCSDISRLMRNINVCTGMSVTSSLKTVNVPKEEAQSCSSPNFLIQPDQISPTLTSTCYQEDSDNSLYNLNDDTSLCLQNDIFPDVMVSTNNSMNKICSEEHNYTISKDMDVGICLHVSNHRVSLEFCSVCNENAVQAWDDSK